MNHDDVQAWIDAYVGAWRTYDPDAIGALFAPDATYAYHPYDESGEILRGRDSIVANWLEERDEPGSWEASYHPLMVEGRRAVVQGTTTTPEATSSGTSGRCVSTIGTDASSSSSGS